MQLVACADGFDLSLEGRLILQHRTGAPCAEVGHGTPDIAMQLGNFSIADQLHERVALTTAHISDDRIALGTPDRPALLTLVIEPGAIRLAAAPGLNRVWLHLAAEPDERVWGGGEQMSYLNLRGRRFPLWTSEPGVGRDPATDITRQAGLAGGDYWWTNYPQPTWLSSRRYALHVDATAYTVFDFTHPGRHTIECWACPARIELWARPTLMDLVRALMARFGRPKPLPDWVFGGAIIGLKDGARSFERLDGIIAADARVSALWCEDWCGLRQTSFGTRLFWDFRHAPARYPELPAHIARLRAQGIRFLGYVNPYLCTDGDLFAEAEAAGLFARTANGATALVDFGEFTCGVLDFTNPAASAWFADRILRREMLDAGLSGWMADFGEYLPTDIVLHDGDPLLKHNAWPVLWAEVNARATEGTDALFFMRAGWSGVQRHRTLLWAGDQSVDFTRHDGLPSAICGALSAGLVGNQASHSDIGGYTSLFGNLRTAELLMRWAEMAAFTPVMRTHEGNRPRDNLQIDDPAILPHFARMTRIWVHLVPYLRAILAEDLPAQRPLFLHYPHDPAIQDTQDAYLYGPDLLVAPVHHAGAAHWTVRLPEGDDWRHIWSGATYAGGQAAAVPSPLGHPPVFARIGSPWTGLFTTLAAAT